MKFEAFETITGSNIGNMSEMECAQDIIKLLSAIPETKEKAGKWQDELISMSLSDNESDVFDFLDELVDELRDYAETPESCSIDWEDNELRVIPYVDDCGTILDDSVDVIYRSNDHGNITCYEFDGDSYKAIWSMV